MIDKDSKIVREFIRTVFETTHKRWYVEHALLSVGSEENMQKIIDYIAANKNVDWQDIEYNIISLKQL